MNIRLKEDILEILLDKMYFTSDGCACGEWGFELDDNLHIYVYRSCRKSSNTPNHKLWHIHDIEFYKKAKYFLEENRSGDKYVDHVEVEEENLIENAKLDAAQKEMIISRCKEITKEIWGNEFRSGD